MLNAPYSFHRQGRSPRTALVLLGVWLALLALWLWVDAAGWIVGLVALFTLPALWDLVTDPPSGLTLTRTEIGWHSGRRKAAVALSEIELVQLDTRLDFSVRVTLVLDNGQKLRLPFEATPPHAQLEAELNARGIKTRRTHFQLFQ